MIQKDDMTIQEALEILKPFKACMFDQWGCPISDAAIALDVVIKALEEPKHTEKCTETHACDCTKCNEYDNEEKTCPHYCEVRRSTEDGLQVETYCKKRKLPSAQSDSKESSFTHKALDLIERQAAIDLVRDVCNAVMSGCESLHDPETKDEVYEDIREVDAILKCNKEVRIALRNMPSAQPIDLQKAYYRGYVDGIKECTARLKKVNEEFANG